MLKRAIEFCLKHKKTKSPVLSSGIKDGLEMLGGGVATNFKPMNAKALYEKYVPKGGVVFDYACGYGGRMLGCLSSKNDYKYIGVEPNKETFNYLNKFGRHIEKATERDNIFSIKNACSEDKIVNNQSSVDFAFSSPPYFNLEKYSEEETQCYNRFKTLDLWFEKYVEPTIINIYNLLRKDRFYAVNISDFKVGKKEFNIVDRWIELSIKNGFKYDSVINMSIQTRRGVGNSGFKKEGIFVFKKD